MSNANQLAFLDATAEAELVRHGEISPAELVEAAIERIDQVNPKLNAVIRPMYEQARSTIANGLPQGPFKGVPLLLKDLVATYAGVPMSSGSRLLENYVPGEDSELVKRFKRAGFVILGKTNTPEFGIAPTTEPQFTGPTRNPWSTDHTPGGSSGGSAAAVASGMVSVAHGNDGGGSIRIPASCCGLFGLKPTRGRNTLGPAVGDVMGGLLCEHVLTRSVRDSAAILDATAGPMPGDPYYPPPPERPFLEEVGANPGRLRIAFTASSLSGTPVHSDCVDAVTDTAALCAELGHEVEEAAPPLDGHPINQAFLAVFAAGCTCSMDVAAELTGRTPKPEFVEPSTWALYQMGQAITSSNYLAAWSLLQQASRSVARFYEEHDVWLTPTLGEPPLPLGTLAATEDNPLAGFFRASEFVPFTPLCNITGQPAASMPLHWNDQDLPIGTHIIGRYGDEATLFRLAAQLEQARPWAHRRPPVSVLADSS